MQILNQISETETESMKKSGISDYVDRTTDIDILFFNDEVIVGKNICIPHPLLHLRNFCIKPFCDIYPDYMHPVLGLKMKDITVVEELNPPVCFMEQVKFDEILQKNI